MNFPLYISPIENSIAFPNINRYLVVAEINKNLLRFKVDEYDNAIEIVQCYKKLIENGFVAEENPSDIVEKDYISVSVLQRSVFYKDDRETQSFDTYEELMQFVL